MFYRVVMQGRTLGGADVDEVKRHFVRVTGLPARVADNFFGGVPQVIKRQVPQSDAERIAATLRAIGAAATVEREPSSTESETPEGIQVVATSLPAGPPTVAPGAVPQADSTPAAARHVRLLRALRDKRLLLMGGTVLVAGAILLAPIVDDLLRSVRSSPTPTRAAPVRATAPEVVPPAPAINPSLLRGPWRCTDQHTGVSAYWSYAAVGVLIFHGDALSDRHTPLGNPPSAPTGWKLDGRRLLHTFAQRAPDTYTVAELTLSHLRYGNDRDLDIECRRP